MSSGRELLAGYVVGQVPAAKCAPAEFFVSAVDGLGGSVAGAGSVEVGQDVGGALLQGPTEGDDLGECLRDVVAERLDQPGHLLATGGTVGFAVGADPVLVDTPGRFDRDVLGFGDQGLAPVPQPNRQH